MIASVSSRCCALLALGRLAEQLRVVAERQLHVVEPLLDVVGHGAEVAALRQVGSDVDPA